MVTCFARSTEAVTWAREQAGLTRAQVAEKLGVTAGLISEIEKGTRNAPPARIRQLAEIFNCPKVVLERKRHAAAARCTR